MKKILVDSSSAILLYKAGMFTRLTEVYQVMLAEVVLTELICDGYQGSSAFKESDVTVFRVSTETSAPFGKGERDTIAGYLQGLGDFVLTDDGAAPRYCKDNGIPFINALLAPKVLCLGGAIDETEQQRATILLLELGRYSRKVIEYAEDCGRRELRFFIP